MRLRNQPSPVIVDGVLWAAILLGLTLMGPGCDEPEEAADGIDARITCMDHCNEEA